VGVRCKDGVVDVDRGGEVVAHGVDIFDRTRQGGHGGAGGVKAKAQGVVGEDGTVVEAMRNLPAVVEG
jgi:hypothetical protein